MRKTRPLLLNTAMVQALLAGNKTQTRRPIKVQPIEDDWQVHSIIGDEKRNGETCFVKPGKVMLVEGETRTKYFKPKLGKVGDLLYVRERARLIGGSATGQMRFEYEADGTKSDWLQKPDRIKMTQYMVGKCCPNGCFKELARIWLKITGVRVERVQDISREDIMKEGVRDDNPNLCAGKMIHDIHVLDDNWKTLWKSVYGESWERNDWVFVYDFERTEKP